MARIKFDNGTIVEFDGNPTPEDVEEVAQKIGISQAPKKKTLLDKAINVGKATSNTLFGSTSKMVGSLIGSGVESAKQLITGKGGEGKFITEKGTAKVFQKEDGTNKSIGGSLVDPIFVGLELMPGGGELTRQLAKIPGGAKVIDGITKALSSIPAKMREGAIKEYASIFKAGSKESKDLVNKVVPKLLEKGEIIKNTQKLAEKYKDIKIASGQKIGEIIDKLPESAKISITSTLKQLDEIKAKYVVNGKVMDDAKYRIVEDTQKRIGQLGSNLKAKDAIQIKRILDESVDDAGGFIADKATKFLAKVEKTASGSIRNKIGKLSPALKKENANFSFASNVNRLANYTSQKAPTVLRQGVGSALGAVISAIKGDNDIESIIGNVALGAIIGRGAVKGLASPAWKSTSAVTRNKVANLLEKGNYKAAGELIRRATTILKNYGESR